MRHLCVIPARLDSSRLPQKPLCLLAGEPLIRVVVKRVLGEYPDIQVVVASDAVQVIEAVHDLNVATELTGAAVSGSDRVAAVTELEPYREAEIVVNVQGDEPLITGAEIRAAVRMAEAGFDIATAGSRLEPDVRWSPNVVKVAVDGAGAALWFGRSVSGIARPPAGRILRHHGIYAYRRAALERFARLPRSESEKATGLEQLRALEAGMNIGVAEVPAAIGGGIDTMEDLVLAEALVGRTCERV